MFTEEETDINIIVDSVTSYVSWCVECIIPVKQVRVFSNNKPWVNKDVKVVLKEKKECFGSKDKEQKKTVQCKLDKAIKNGKHQHRRRIEQHFESNNMKKVWDGLNLMGGRTNVNRGSVYCESKEYTNEVNNFYSRFDSHDFSKERDDLKKELLISNKSYNDIIIDESEVLKTMKKLNPTKAKGPDGVGPRVLKLCANQLCGIFSFLFNLSLSNCIIPNLWKTSCIIPVPKKPNVKVMNDYRPIALTPCVMKVFEKCFMSCFQCITSNYIDPLQFAYRKNRSVDDALLYVLNKVYSHLEKTSSSVRIMFYDFSSAFNTIQCHLLGRKLMNMNVSPYTILWILDYLTKRPQYVKINCSPADKSRSSQFLSDTLFTNTGCPQGTVLSPYLFSIYTSDSRESHDQCSLIKYADDTALTGLILEDDFTHYLNAIHNFVQWCDNNFLELNVGKTKEMIIDFRKNSNEPPPIMLKGKKVERVSSYKYLGTTIDENLSWSQNTTNIIAKVNTRMYCLRNLHTFNVNTNMLQLFFRSVVCSVLIFGVTSWGGNIMQKDKDKLDRIIRKAGRVIGERQDTITDLYNDRLVRKLKGIFDDDKHPLRQEFNKLVIQRSGRLRTPKIRTTRFQNSFLCQAVNTYNSGHLR